ncbi:MAG TPA: ABC transporter substrate-binding protein, partial [Candidatus Binatia bacterium]|nr:ABC transporter substrate-binding protein [Candidatus Binatia bacterium]
SNGVVESSSVGSIRLRAPLHDANTPIRRKLLRLCPILCAVLFALCSTVDAQQPKKLSRIGLLAVVQSPQHEAFQQGLRDLGYIEGENIVIERRYTKGDQHKVPELAAGLVSLKVDVIVSFGPVTPFAAKGIKSIPMVMGYSGDPVDAGIVASLARPGGNVTGMSFFAAALAGKRVELLKESVSKVSRVAILANPGHAGEQLELRETETAARALNVAHQYLPVRAADDFNGAFRIVARERAEGLIVFPDALTMAHRKQIAEFSVKSRIATMSGWSQFVEAGGLISYGPNLSDSFRRVATHVDKILKGAKPADLPVEQPTKFELVINLKTAKQIGVTIPPNVLARADRVIR